MTCLKRKLSEDVEDHDVEVIGPPYRTARKTPKIQPCVIPVTSTFECDHHPMPQEQDEVGPATLPQAENGASANPASTDPAAGQEDASQASQLTEVSIGACHYRNILEMNNIIFNYGALHCPESVVDVLDTVLCGHGEDKSTLSHGRLDSLMYSHERFAKANDFELEEALSTMKLLPESGSYRQRMVVLPGVHLGKVALPRSQYPSVPEIIPPEASRLHGYHQQIFNAKDKRVLMSSKLFPLSHIEGTDLFLPRLIMEFVAPSHGDSTWAAENQAAAAGAHCVNCIETILSLAREKTGAEREITDSMAWPCIVEPKCITMWAHWKDDDGRHVSTQFEGHFLFKIEHLQMFHMHIRSVLAFIAKDQFKAMKKALKVLHDHVGELNVPQQAENGRVRVSAVEPEPTTMRSHFRGH